jgi:hypothetical protein
MHFWLGHFSSSILLFIPLYSHYSSSNHSFLSLIVWKEKELNIFYFHISSISLQPKRLKRMWFFLNFFNTCLSTFAPSTLDWDRNLPRNSQNFILKPLSVTKKSLLFPYSF